MCMCVSALGDDHDGQFVLCSLLGAARLQVHILFLWRYRRIRLITHEYGSLIQSIYCLSLHEVIATLLPMSIHVL